jgi:short-subunit dehydrogenase
MNIIITGASSGIGYELVLEFAADSSNTIIAISRNEEKLLKLEDLVSLKNKAKLIIIREDISKINIETFLIKVKEHIERIDILINNAGFLINKPFIETTKEDWEKLLSVNLLSPVNIIKALYSLMGGENATHIINIGSMGGYQGSAKFSGLSAYSASKAALANFTECIAEEFKGKNIYSNCLALGAVQTEMLGQAFPGYDAPITANEMAKFIKNFALNGHKYMNGKVIPVSIQTP